ncbi:ABC transporter substrate-binding protein [Kineothrix sp. MB12-C1]|uniref:ABC transporter substrate-binding protein n=1 Tax=Kineothrix sp. MB12-C1 TaxID=3070215 RepID=UPI0027D2BA06|nr:extracellular solute-binding protein [Kineothrix sp. MB12-C1]WMC92634.1 extracellular solute-binding protein [Kineothrix sp. MB12-C1]
MKKSVLKKMLIAVTAALACMQLAACGGSKGNTTAQKEFVYVPEYQNIDSGNSSIDAVNVIGNTIYYLAYEYDEVKQTSTSYLCALEIGAKEPVKTALDFGDNATVMRMTANADGTLQALINTYVYEEGASIGGEEIEALDGEEGLAEAEDASEAVEDSEETEAVVEEGTESENDEAAEVEASNSVTIMDGGTTIVSESSMPGNAYVDDYMMPTSQKTEICKISTDGTIMSTMDITSVFGDEEVYFNNMETDNDGNIYLAYDQAIWVIDQEGNELFQVEIDSWVNNMFVTKDGVVMITYYGQESMEVCPIDVAKKGLGDAVSSMMVSQYGNYIFGRSVETDVLYSVDNILYSYNMGDAAPVEILNWIDCDINSNELVVFHALDDGRILTISSFWEEDTSNIELTYLTKKKGSEVPEKKIMSLATMYLDYEMRKQVIDFNKKSQEYRIEVKEYMSASNDYEAGLTQLNTDIISGNAPDMVDLSNGSMKQYIAKGILEDLSPFLEKDAELKREDYLENVLKAYEVDGKLYAIPPYFYLQTVVAKTADVGERTSISMAELIDMVKNLPEGTELYEYGTKSTILMYNTMMNMDEYVDWSTGECKFNGEEFINALEFANYFDENYNWDEERPSTPERLQNGTLLMLNTGISAVTDYQMTKLLFKEPITFIGFPTSKENGSFLSGTGGVLGMSAKSKNKEGVWEFLRIAITKESQEKSDNRGRWGFPIMKSALELQFTEAMKEDYYEDADGNQIKQPKTSWSYDGYDMEIYAATEEEIKEVRSLIESIDTQYQYDEQMNAIISEEAAAFFEGQKNAKEVADIIQSRVQIYVNENR